ncbi:hypothetical protein R6Q57_026916 [Mikania cordata]
MGNFNDDSRIVRNEKPATPMIDSGSKRMVAMYAGSVFFTYNALVQYLRWKYIGRKETPFQTQSFLIHTSIASFLVGGLTIPILVNDYLSKSTWKPFSPVIFRIIKIVCFIACVLAHLSLVLILIID